MDEIKLGISIDIEGKHFDKAITVVPSNIDTSRISEALTRGYSLLTYNMMTNLKDFFKLPIKSKNDK